MTTNVESHAGQSVTPREGGSCFEFKGSMITMIELHLLDPALPNFPADIKKKVSQAPDFLSRAPVVVDLSVLKNSDQAIDFNQISEVLKRNQFIPLGVRNGSREHQQQAQNAGWYVLPASTARGNDILSSDTKAREATNSEGDKAQAKPAAAAPKLSSYSKTIYQPVRSGQQIYAKGCDLVVLATVSAGADIIADGHIHVYGALRGRALAGVNGDESARIFCQNLEAQLISIAGYYRVIEEIEESMRHQSVQVFLKDQRVTVEKL